jgi:hypothetical protein
MTPDASSGICLSPTGDSSSPRALVLSGSPIRLKRLEELTQGLIQDGVQGDAITPDLLRERILPSQILRVQVHNNVEQRTTPIRDMARRILIATYQDGVQGDAITPDLLRERIFSDTYNHPQSICCDDPSPPDPTRPNTTSPPRFFESKFITMLNKELLLFWEGRWYLAGLGLEGKGLC